MKLIRLFFFSIVILTYTSCEKDPDVVDMNSSDNNQMMDDVNVIQFTVEGITIQNGLVESLTSTSVALSGSVPTIAPSLAPIFEHGHFLYTEYPTENNFKSSIVRQSNLGPINKMDYSYESSFSGLEPSKTYYYLSYVKALTNNLMDTVTAVPAEMKINDEVVPLARSFNTVSNEFPPGVSTLARKLLGPNRFEVFGSIDENSNTILEQYGFAWKEGLSSNPTLQDNSGNINSGTNQNVTNGTHFSSSIILNPNTIYTLRSYAKNKFGVDYGSPLIVFGEHNWSSYNSFPESIFEKCYAELFQENTRNWFDDMSSTYDVRYNFNESGNYFSIDNDEEDTNISYETPQISLTGISQYQIDVDVRVTIGDYSSGIIWEASNDRDGAYLFGFDREDRAYQIGYWNTNDEWTSLKYQEEWNLLTPSDYHKLSVRKVNNIFYLFINGTLVHSFTKILPKGDNIRFRAARNSNVYFKNYLVNSFDECN